MAVVVVVIVMESFTWIALATLGLGIGKLLHSFHSNTLYPTLIKVLHLSCDRIPLRWYRRG